MARKLRCIRILVQEGDEHWVKDTIARAVVRRNKPFICPSGRIKSMVEVIEYFTGEEEVKG